MDNIRAFLQSQIDSGISMHRISRCSGVSVATISRICSNPDFSVNIVTANKLLHPFGYTLAINYIGQSPIPCDPPDDIQTC